MKNKNTRKLTKIAGHSVAVVIPINLVKGLKWREKQKVQVKRVARGVKITDARSKRKR